MANLQAKPTTDYCTRFGSIAVEQGFITAEQLKLALDEQVNDDLAGRPHRVIGAICFTHGWMTPQQIDTVLNRLFQSRAKRAKWQPQSPAMAG